MRQTMRPIEFPSSAFDRLGASARATPAAISRRVTQILDAVRRNGDAALLKLTHQFDGVKLKRSELRLPASRLQRATVPRELQKAGRQTLRQVSHFARASLPRAWQMRNAHGAVVGEKFDPLRRVGVYIPGGSVPLVSTVFMTVAIARVTGVREIVACTPPPVDNAILWALRLCGATEVWPIGGAQAVAAMAFGTPTLRPVDKIFGPGNAYVTEAKRQVFGTVGVDLLAGPSELMVLADETTNPEWAALDLLAQAEHGSGRERIFCASPSLRVLRRIHAAVEEGARRHPSHAALRRVLREGAAWIHVKNREGLADAANHLAPEHLQIMTRQPRELAARIRTAGGIFLGNRTPTVLGDFAAGPSHTLPTSGAGRAFSGLRTADFMRRTSLVEYTDAALIRAAPTVAAFATAEKLPLHGESLAARVPRSPRRRKA